MNITGRSFTYMGGSTITPQPLRVHVVWDDGDNIHYRNGDQTKINQTSRERFFQIAGLEQ